MGEFRIGRKYAQHSYPDTRRDTTLPLARNFAVGPPVKTSVTPNPSGFPIPWSVIESEGAVGPGVVNVPITPTTSAIAQVSGVITITNNGAASATAQVLVQTVGPGSFVFAPENEFETIAPGATVAIPVSTLGTNVSPIDSTVSLQLLIVASPGSSLQLVENSTTFGIQEVPAATG